MVGAALDRSEPSPRFASDGIHTKSGVDNLQGNDLGKGLGASLLVICSSLVAYTLSLYVYIHEVFIILSCYLNCGLT